MKEEKEERILSRVSKQLSNQISKKKAVREQKEEEREKRAQAKEEEKEKRAQEKEEERERDKAETEIEFKFKKRSDEFKKYFNYFLVIAGSMVFFIIIFRLDKVVSAVQAFLSAASPVISGIAIAYVLNPVVKKFEEGILKIRSKKERDPVKNKKFCRRLSIAITMVLMLVMIAAVFAIVIPEVTNSLAGLFDTLPDRLQEIEKWWESFPERFPALYSNKLIAPYVKMGVDYITDGLNGGLISTIFDWLTYLLGGLMGAVNVLYNVVIGMIIAVYLLAGKETFLANGKRIILASMSRRKSENVLKIVKTTHKIFGGAITGKLIDSLLVGLICYIVLTIFGIPYASLVSVIVGITNVIPFLGPFIGAIPSAILIFIVDPSKGILFIVIILIIQQIDCNLLDPYIVGNSIGLSPFWEIAACLVGGSLFGIWGLLLGVPVFALGYSLFGQLLNAKLEDKELPAESELYYQDCTYEQLKEEAERQKNMEESL